MKHWRRTAANLLLVAIVAAGILGEALHHESLAVRLSTDPLVAPHRCGDQERHVPLDGLHPCTLCTGFSQRVFTAVSPQAVTAPVRTLLGILAAGRDETLSADQFIHKSRGPPVV